MKSIVFWIVSLLFFNFSFAQITIKSTDMPSSGKNYYYSTSIEKINLDSMGKQSWDYSQMIPTRSDTAKYITTGFNPITFATFFGNLQTKTRTFGQDGYQFFNPKSAAYIQTGVGLRFGTIDAPIKYSRVDTIFKLPLDYGNTHSDSFSGALTVGINLKISGKRDYSVDAYGSMKTPFGIFDVIRVKTILKTSYTLTVGGFGIPVPFNTTEYRWLAKGQAYPILQVIDNGVTKTVTYADSARNIVDTNAVVPDFVANDSSVFVDDTVSFINLSKKTNPITGYNWTVSPGVVTTDYQFVQGFGNTAKDPKIVFLAEGKYSISLRAGGIFGFGGVVKTKTEYINVKLPNLPDVDFSASTTNIAPGKRVVLRDLSLNNPKKWKWEITPNNFFFIESTDTFSKNPVISFSSEGKYSVKLTATNAAGKSSISKADYINVDKSISIEAMNALSNNLTIFPNPANDFLNITLDEKFNLKNAHILIIDGSGRVLFEKLIINRIQKVDIQYLPFGIYHLLVVNTELKLSKRISIY